MKKLNQVLVVVFVLVMHVSWSQIIVGTYTGIDHATNYTNPQQGAACGPMPAINASIGDANFVDGSAEVPLGWQFSGTWDSGLTYFDGPGVELLLVSLHTYTESWFVALRLSNGTTTAFQPYDLTIVTTNATGSLTHCGGLVPSANFERPSQELDFASYAIPAGAGVIGIVFEPYSDGAGNPDPHGVMVLQGTLVSTPCDTIITTTASICQGDSLLFQGNYYNSTGIYDDTLQNVLNCDSILSLDLNVLSTSLLNQNQSICQGDSSFLEGAFQTIGGVYNDTLQTVLGCDSIISTTLTINPLPAVDGGLDQTICSGQDVVLTGSGALTYIWDNAVLNTIPFNPIATNTYTVTGTDLNGCVNTDQVIVTVIGIPIVNAGADVVLCLGDSVLLNATGNADTYIWTTATVNGDYFTPASTIQATVTGTAANGCVVTDSLMITVNPLPIFDAGADQFLCEGTLVTLQGIGVGTITWDNSVIDNVPFNQANGTVTYNAIIVDAVGCVNADSVTVTVQPVPIASFTADVLEGCSPLEVTFTNTTQGSLSDCSWDFGNNQFGSGCGTVTAIFDSSGTYSVTLTTFTIAGCSNTITYTDYIYVEADPIANFLSTPDNIGWLDSEVQFTNQSSGAVSYIWNFDDGSPNSTVESPIHEFDAEYASSYLIQLIAFSPLMCTDTVYSAIVVNEELIFYVPNSFTPDGDEHNQTFQPVFTSGFDRFDYQISIFNRWGELVFESSNSEIGWNGYCANSLCQSGVYTWRIEYKMLNGDERRVEHGHVNVLR